MNVEIKITFLFLFTFFLGGGRMNILLDVIDTKNKQHKYVKHSMPICDNTKFICNVLMKVPTEVH